MKAESTRSNSLPTYKRPLFENTNCVFSFCLIYQFWFWTICYKWTTAKKGGGCSILADYRWVLVISEVARVRVCEHWFRSTNCLQTQFLSSAVSTYQDQDHRRIIATVKNIYNVNVLSVWPQYLLSALWVKRMLSKFLEGLLECRFWICCIVASNIFLSRKFARELGRRGLERAHKPKSIFTFKNLLALEVLWVVVNVFIRRWLDDSFTSYNSQVSFVLPYGAVLPQSPMILLAAQHNLGYWLAD